MLEAIEVVVDTEKRVLPVQKSVETTKIEVFY